MKPEAGKREKGKAAVGRRTFPHCGTGANFCNFHNAKHLELRQPFHLRGAPKRHYGATAAGLL